MHNDISSATGSFVKLVFSVVLWSFILFNVGRATLLICTLGSYPRGRALARHNNRISFVGVLVIAALWASIAVHNTLVHV